MSERIPATDKGTADRIEADDGGYWVRLVTKQALKREGVCMGNCLDSQDYGEHLAGDEDMMADGLWSLRKVDGLSYLLVEVNDLCATDTRSARIENALGPKNSQPSGWSIRQLRHLVAAFRVAGSVMQVPESIALTGEDGRTWRPDKAPQALKDAVEAKRKAEAEKQRTYEIPYGQLIFRPVGADGPVFEVIGGGSSRSWTVNPSGEDRDEAPECSDDVVLYRDGPEEPFQTLRGQERLAAIRSAIARGILHGHNVSMDFGGFRGSTVETVIVRARGDLGQFTTMNEDGTLKLHLGDLVFPRVVAASYEIEEFGFANTMTFRVVPPRGGPCVRFASNREAVHVRPEPQSGGFPGGGGGGGYIIESSGSIRMKPMLFESLQAGLDMMAAPGSSPGGGGSEA
ncbi:hypothetical protein AU375_04075 [Methylobacterium radiotolerans]|nr:hypothetical protein AU375_04075 [Methylobacterium radiotolerans]